jgi:hypothetical protein
MNGIEYAGARIVDEKITATIEHLGRDRIAHNAARKKTDKADKKNRRRTKRAKRT